MKEFFNGLWNNQTAFTRFVRGLMLGGSAAVGTGGGTVDEVNWVATVLAMIAGAIGAGEPNK